jgi:hypothetical protein
MRLLRKAQIKMFKRGVAPFVTISVNGLRVLEVSDPSVCECEASRAR